MRGVSLTTNGFAPAHEERFSSTLARSSPPLSPAAASALASTTSFAKSPAPSSTPTGAPPPPAPPLAPLLTGTRFGRATVLMGACQGRAGRVKRVYGIPFGYRGPALETTGQAAGGARLQHAKLGRTPRSTASTQGLRDSDARPGGPCIRGATASVSLTAAETTGPAEDDLCPAQLAYTPLQPLSPQRQTTQRGPAQQHSLQWRQPAKQTIDTANHLPAQQRPCGRDNQPGKLHLSKPTLPLCSPLCRYGPNNSAVENIQTSRSSNGVHELFTICGSISEPGCSKFV
jgi:hypothetical protein